MDVSNYSHPFIVSQNLEVDAIEQALHAIESQPPVFLDKDAFTSSVPSPVSSLYPFMDDTPFGIASADSPKVTNHGSTGYTTLTDGGLTINVPPGRQSATLSVNGSVLQSIGDLRSNPHILDQLVCSGQISAQDAQMLKESLGSDAGSHPQVSSDGSTGYTTLTNGGLTINVPPGRQSATLSVNGSAPQFIGDLRSNPHILDQLVSSGQMSSQDAQALKESFGAETIS